MLKDLLAFSSATSQPRSCSSVAASAVYPSCCPQTKEDSDFQLPPLHGNALGAELPKTDEQDCRPEKSLPQSQASQCRVIERAVPSNIRGVLNPSGGTIISRLKQDKCGDSLRRGGKHSGGDQRADSERERRHKGRAMMLTLEIQPGRENSTSSGGVTY